MNGHEYFSATQALEEKRVFPHLQAIEPLDTKGIPTSQKTIIDFESLARGETEDGSLVGAYDLIRAAKAEHIWPVVHWHLTELSLEFAGKFRTGMSINIDTEILETGDFPEKLAKSMRRNGLQNGDITVELTENMEKPKNGRLKSLEKLFGRRKLDDGSMINVRGAADDFPEAHSSQNFHEIVRINPHATPLLKVDYRTVQGLVDGNGTYELCLQRIVSAMNLARGKGAELLFEGVEPSGQYGPRLRTMLKGMTEEQLSPAHLYVQIGRDESLKRAQAILEGKKSLRPHKSQSAPVRSRGSRHVSSSAL